MTMLIILEEGISPVSHRLIDEAAARADVCLIRGLDRSVGSIVCSEWIEGDAGGDGVRYRSLLEHAGKGYSEILRIGSPWRIFNLDFVEELIAQRDETGSNYVQLSPEACLCSDLVVELLSSELCLSVAAQSDELFSDEGYLRVSTLHGGKHAATLDYAGGGEFPIDPRNIRSVASVYPVNVALDIVDVCNMSCRKCSMYEQDSFYLKKHTVTEKIMPFDNCIEALEKTLAPGQGNVTFSNRGEPLCHPDIVSIIKYCTDRGWRTHITTNMKAMDPEMTDALLDAGLSSIMMSIDSVQPAVYNRLHRGGDYTQTFGNVSAFLAANARAGIPVFVHFAEYPDDNGREFSEFLAYWRNKANGVMRAALTDVQDEGCARMFTFAPPPKHRYPCNFVFGTVQIMCDGTIIECCGAYGKSDLGNIFEMEDIQILWNGEYYTRQREAQLRGIYDCGPCGTCEAWYANFVSRRLDELHQQVKICPFREVYTPRIEVRP